MNTLAKKDDKRYEYFIYKLYNPDCHFIYVGSTRDMTTRKSNHKTHCNNVNDKKYNYKVYQTIREHDGFENWFMVVIEVMPNVTKLEAEMKEDAYRMELNATMNTYRATRGLMTEQEYNKEYKTQYYQNNKETISAKQNKKHNCECGGRYVQGSIARHMKTQKHQNYISNNNL